MKEGGIFKADAEYNERKNKNGVYRDKMRVLLVFFRNDNSTDFILRCRFRCINEM